MFVEAEQDGAWSPIAEVTAKVDSSRSAATAEWKMPVPPGHAEALAAREQARRGNLVRAAWAEPQVADGGALTARIEVEGIEGEKLVVLGLGISTRVSIGSDKRGSVALPQPMKQPSHKGEKPANRAPRALASAVRARLRQRRRPRSGLRKRQRPRSNRGRWMMTEEDVRESPVVHGTDRISFAPRGRGLRCGRRHCYRRRGPGAPSSSGCGCCCSWRRDGPSPRRRLDRSGSGCHRRRGRRRRR